MRLLLVTQDFPPDTGGIQTYCAEIAGELNRLCDFLAVLAPAVPDANSVDEQLDYPVHRVRASYDTFPARSIPQLRRTIRGAGIDTVFHAQWQTIVASAAARTLGQDIRIFTAAHGRELLINPLGAVPLLGEGFNRFRRRMLRRPEGFFPVSRFTKSLLEEDGVHSEKIDVVNNGTDPERFRPVDPSRMRRRLDIGDRPTLLTVGRLVRRKGIDTVLRALPTLLKRVPDTVYVVAGDGPDRDRLESLARQLGVWEHTRFAGRVPHDQLVEYYSACHVFVLAARTEPPSVEGFGIVFLEANACGRPVIGTRSGGIPDAVADGETGYLVRTNDPGALAGKAAYLLTNPATARRMGEAGRRRVLESFTWNRAARTIYERINPHP